MEKKEKLRVKQEVLQTEISQRKQKIEDLEGELKRLNEEIQQRRAGEKAKHAESVNELSQMNDQLKENLEALLLASPRR